MTEEFNNSIQQWIRDFDKEAKPINGIMFIKVPDANGGVLHLNIDEYLQYKIKNG